MCLVAGDGGSEANYRVVDTDYDSYAIVYDCSPFPVIKKGELAVMLVMMAVVDEILIIMLLYITRVPVVTDQTAVASQELGPVGLQVRPPQPAPGLYWPILQADEIAGSACQ